MRAVLCALILCVLAGTGFAQLALNEIYISHSGLDDQEYVEIVGPAGTSLANHAILVVESDAGTALGTLDRFYDLSAGVIPGDGYFVAGVTAVANLDLNIGTDNQLENSSATYYLIEAPTAMDLINISAMVGMDVSSGVGTTVIPSMATVLDNVMVFDGGAGDTAFDGAPTVGPDGPFLPAGIFRGSDFPQPWCNVAFLDFDDVSNTSEMRTPGAANTVCPGGSNLPGSGSDCDQQIRVNGSIDNNAADVHIVANSTDVLAIRYLSPLGTLDGRGFFATLQLLPTASPPAGIPVPGVGTLYFDLTPGVPTALVYNSLPGAPANVIVPVIGFTEVNFILPAFAFGSGLSVFSVMIADDPSNPLNFGFADTHEFQLL